MSVKLQIRNDENKHLENLSLDSPRLEISISDELSSASDIFISRYDTLVNLTYLKNNQSSHIIGISPALEDEVKDIVTLLNKKASNNLGFRTTAKKKTSATIASEQDFDQTFEKVSQNLSLEDYHESIADKIKLVINEFYTNDIFHRGHGQEAGIVSTTQDDKKTIIAYHCKAKLKKEEIVNSLHRAAKEKKPKKDGRGAGLGLYMVLENCDQMHIVTETNTTTFYVTFEKNKRYKNISKRTPSISFYEIKD